MFDQLRVVRHSIGKTVRTLQLGSAIRRIRSGSCSEKILTRLLQGWHNEGFSADTAYLSAVAKYAAMAEGDVLECGSGTSTLLLAAITEGTGRRVHALEHMPEWREKVCAKLKKHRLTAEVHLAPLEAHGEFHWYKIPETLPRHFTLVVCDGPPGSTHGGRFGLLPCVGDRLREAVILVDDTERPGEQLILERWRSEYGVHYEMICNNEGSYALAHLPPNSQIATKPEV